MAYRGRRATRLSTKRNTASPSEDFPPQKSQNFKKSRPENFPKKVSPEKEKMIWGARALAYKEKYGRSFVTDSEGETSETSEAAKLLKNLKIPKKGDLEKKSVETNMEEKSPLDHLAASEKPKTNEDLFHAIYTAFQLTNKNITSTRSSLQNQIDTVASGVRTNTRAVLKSRKDLLAVTDRVLELERRNLGNSILVYDHGLGIPQLKSWQKREETVTTLLRMALGITSDLDYLFKIVKTEARIPRVQGPGVKPPPIKVFFPSAAAYDYMATVVQYPSKLRDWHRNVQGKRGSLPKFSIKPNVTFLDRQRAQYARKVVENLKAQEDQEGVRFEVTPYGGIRKLEEGQAKMFSFEKIFTVFANFLPLEQESEDREQVQQVQAPPSQNGDDEAPYSPGIIHVDEPNHMEEEFCSPENT